MQEFYIITQLCFEILQFKNTAIWLHMNILGYNYETKILPDMGFALKNQSQYDFSFYSSPAKNNDRIFWKITKTSFLGHIGLFLLEYRQMQKSAPLVFNILQLLNNIAIA